MAKRAHTSYWKKQWDLFSGSFSKLSKANAYVAVIDVLTGAALWGLISSWTNKMATLGSSLDAFDPEYLLSGAATEAQLATATEAMQTAVMSIVGNVLLFGVLAIAILVFSRYAVWRKLLLDVTSVDWKSFKSFLGMSLLMGVIGVVFLAYPILGIAQLSPTSTPGDVMYRWAMTLGVFIGLFQYFRINVVYQHIVHKKKAVRAVGDGIKTAIGNFTTLIVPALAVYVPLYIIPGLEARLLAYAGWGLNYVRLGTVVLILAWGRMYFTTVIKEHKL